MSEAEAVADEEEPAAEILSNNYDELANIFNSPVSSIAASMTETIDSREEVHYCDEWELFSGPASDRCGASDNEGSLHSQSENEADQLSPSCVVSDPQQAATGIRIESVVVLERSQRDDTDRQNSVTLDDTKPDSMPLCSGYDEPSLEAQQKRPTSRYDDVDTVYRCIQVVVRVRPHIDCDSKMAVTMGEKEGISLRVQSPISQDNTSMVTECTFDRVFMGCATQEDVFAAVQPNVQACLEGYNSTIFAYGQTGTGKTHTLFGGNLGSHRETDGVSGGNDSRGMMRPSYGIVPRTLSYLLDQALLMELKNYHVELHLSFLQIYNDRLFDLLTDRMRQKPLLIREQPTLEGTTSVTVQGVSSERISSFSNAMKIIQLGHTNRCVRETESNLSSSRSHAIVQLNVTIRYPASNGEGQVHRRARLNLVDLAGSEKWNTDVEMEDGHLQELKNINSSLSALGKCIAALTESGRKHIPYRDSTLTRVLQDSLGGNTQSCLIATVNATQQSCDETIRTLHFADRARSVMQTIRVNEVADGSTELLSAKIQIVKLRERLESEQRRRRETRLKEHQAMQRDFQEKLKGKDKEIAKLTKDNAVFQRWREEDVKKIRALESRVKDLEQQIDVSDGRASETLMDVAISAVVDGSRRQNAVSESISVVKHTPVQKTRSRANLTRVGSEDGSVARTYKQVLERYALGASKGPEAKNSSDIAFGQAQQNSLYDSTNQFEGPRGSQPAAPDIKISIKQQSRWDAAVDGSRSGESSKISILDEPQFPASALCIPPVVCHPSAAAVVPTKSFNNSWTYSNLASTATNVSTEWASSMLPKSTSTFLIQKQDNRDKLERWSSNQANASNTTVPKQDLLVLKSASTGNSSYSPPARVLGAINSTIELCQKHKLAGCMLCSVNGNSLQAQATLKGLQTNSESLKVNGVIRKLQDGPCERHTLLRCFICMKSSSATSNGSQASATSISATVSSNYGFPANSPSGNPLNYQNPTFQGENQSKCALHSLANCILCAGVKVMTRKVVVPTPQASPAKVPTSFDARNGNHVIDERYRRYTLDERILNYQTQSNLANQW
ncbi:Kinesin-like protein [Phytophthora palmivora]|uniref:Kinesin-like protein n=1 Tax=Phytophthora palmivora TaxID=4796 RepID=A0A2P4YL72_9STRA|nr:Kinesin-like protein [Phytophthora palmivora]